MRGAGPTFLGRVGAYPLTLTATLELRLGPRGAQEGKHQ